MLQKLCFSIKPFNRCFTTTIIKQYLLIDQLKNRGLISQVSQPENILYEKLKSGKSLKLYLGVDPTAKSLHLGNVIPLMLLLQFYLHGHDVVALVGGATGKVGDPSGKKTARKMIVNEQREINIKAIEFQLKRFFQNAIKYLESLNKRTKYPLTFQKTITSKYKLLNNIDWLGDVKLLDFLAAYGSHIRIQPMLSRDSVSARLNSNEGLGFNEFTYQILQAYDFLHLNTVHKIDVQIGGNDQWGNITAGIDLISRIQKNQTENITNNIQPFAITVPLLTTSTGEKFGKSAGNAIFIDPEMNSAFDIYQYFVNTTDDDLLKYFKLFTLLSEQEIKEVVENHFSEGPKKRFGQKRLAWEVTELLYGTNTGTESEKVSELLFSDNTEKLTVKDTADLFIKMRIVQDVSCTDTLVNILCKLLSCSRNEAIRKIRQGGIYLGPQRERTTADITDFSPFISNDLLYIKIGKQKSFVLKFV
ncbi:hypothetical protein TBLA_0H03850 [Henningerozyma blattae CBS 6284]|uniref:Tyrosine--tRNA ligase n=1 Tax=Henningerozyma blattae (strain ATCC 34711 / CBS 6284 / DSM 70876 / NBRC 10599 / NRRL Y-10934 / UCD 77-7) TaxID=1071380 RepID=I2H8G4_HENB6|nr:hypothetical protein TBLA_0H03850 [Tetrapisispora blattae CBS 6284]CCH62666.1 hypothetical protein TBLA_0H03850 [Tetrapisispora blattae CBS 6284]